MEIVIMATKGQVIKAPFKISWALLKFIYIFIYRFIVILLLLGITIIFFIKGGYKVTTKVSGALVDNIAKPAADGLVNVADKLDKSSDNFEKVTFKSRGRDMIKAAWSNTMTTTGTTFNKFRKKLSGEREK